MAKAITILQPHLLRQPLSMLMLHAYLRIVTPIVLKDVETLKAQCSRDVALSEAETCKGRMENLKWKRTWKMKWKPQGPFKRFYRDYIGMVPDNRESSGTEHENAMKLILPGFVGDFIL